MDLHFVNKENAPDMPKVLYKYRTWDKEKHKRLITHSEIYYSSPDELDELTECIYERDYESVTDAMIMDLCMETAMKEVDFGKIPIHSVFDRAKYLFSINDFYDLDHRKNDEKEFRNSLNKELSIFCSSETPTNERLWDTFAKDKSGYCVGIDFTEIYSNNEVFGTCGRVNYYPKNNPPKFPPIVPPNERANKMMEIMFGLPDNFKDEEEFRFTKLNIPNKRLKIKPEWIKEVIIGSQASEDAEREIVEIVKEKYPNAILKRLFVEPTFNVLSIVDL